MNKQIQSVIPRPSRPNMVGDGFRVFNLIPGGVSQQRISPFLMLDFAAEHSFSPSERERGVDVHPHKGFETVTIAYKGSIAHNDSAGNSGVINPGDVQWMTAGSGILHKEYHEENYSKRGGPFEMVQLWVNLPKKDKLTKPHYQALTADQMGKAELPDNGGQVNVIAGTINNITGPAQTYTPVIVADIRLNAGAQLATTTPADYNTALLLIKGSAEVNGQPAPEHSFVLFANEGEDITITATEPATILLLSGEPLNEPIASYGPFVMNTKEELVESIFEARTGKYGVLK